MRQKAMGRIAVFSILGLILFLVTGSSAALAAPTTDQGAAVQKPVNIHPSNRHQARSSRHSSRRFAGSDKQQTKTSSANKAGAATSSDMDQKAAANDKSAVPQGNAFSMPPSVANANAQLTENTEPIQDTQPTAQANDQANDQAQANGQANDQPTRYMVAADQVNEIDLAATGLPAPKLMNLSVENHDDTDFAQTSTIGRIFIAIGGLLTIGSAVRLFVV